MSISNTRFNRRAQLIRTEAGERGTSSSASEPLLYFCFWLSARNDLGAQLGILRDQVKPWPGSEHCSQLYKES